ncbi:hypothetical protein BH23ACT6_BH23ACT6_24640 [soil metagenome]
MTEQAAITSDLDLLRTFEPVVRFTRGEFFFPVSAARYAEQAALWSDDPDGESVREYPPGTLDLSLLSAHCTTNQGLAHSLSGVDTGTGHERPVRIPLKDRPPLLRGSSRLASVGVTARLIDAANRLSLLFRGSVPGGSAARSFLLQRDHLDVDQPTYYGRIVRDGDWIIAQYWFFYCFNNWRSGFGGVNEHEGDWEQVTVYLDGTGEVDAAGLPPGRWVVFSAHDEVGDDLRRRWDDPDLSLVEGRHAVVFAGAGSHSGAYLPGDYLITVQPPTLPWVVRGLRGAARVFTPWSTTAKGGGLAIPYVDYARGDGRGLGPGEAEGWHPVVLDTVEHDDWVRAYRGLWGHDTRDRLGGERGPAGPRYERDGSVRASWADPVGWSGLAKVSANPAVAQALVVSRQEQIRERLGELDEDIEAAHSGLIRSAAGLAPASPEVRAMAPEEQRLLQLKIERTALADEVTHLEATTHSHPPVADPHDHLVHRLTPLEPVRGIRSTLLSWWAVLSTPLILCSIAFVISPVFGYSSPLIAVVSVLLLMGVEGLLRKQFLAVALRFVVLAASVVALYYAYQEWRYVVTVPCFVAAFVVLVVNLRERLRR